MQPYTPNFSDPRVQKRIKHALGFTLACMGSKPSRWAKVTLDRYFGSQNHELSRWLRQVLLITTDDHYSKDEGIPKQYVLRSKGRTYLTQVLTGQTKAGWNEWKQKHRDESRDEEQVTIDDELILLPAPAPSVAQVPGQDELSTQAIFDNLMVDKWVEREFGSDLAALAFNYTDKSSRLWHPLQNVRQAHKKRVLSAAGLRYSYDIECAAPTLLHQYAQSLPELPQHGIWPMDLYLFALRFYLRHRSDARQRLASLLEVDVSYAKTVLNSLFCGARIGSGEHFSLYRLLGTTERIDRLKNDTFIQHLVKDVKVLWSYIEPTLPRYEKKDKNGVTRKVPLNSRRKWAVYFDLERKVLDVVRAYLTEKGIKHFLEHDGWSTDTAIDVADLIETIKARTGFDIRLKVEHHLPGSTS